MDLHKLTYFKKPDNIKLFLQVLVFLIFLKILLKMVKLPRLFRLIESKKRIPIDSSHVAYMMTFANFILYRLFRSANPCLLRSLLLFRQLRMMGTDIKIAFGVKDDRDGLKGHAWLIKGETPVLEQNDPSIEYQTVLVYP